MKQRIWTGLIAGAGIIGLMIIGGPLYYGLLLLLALIGYYEFVRMNGIKWHHPAALAGFIGMLCFVWPQAWSPFELTQPTFMLWLMMFIFMAITVLTKNRMTIDHAANLFLGLVYIGFGFSAMIQIRQIDTYGLHATFLAFGCIWASDIGAYFCGRLFGRRKLWPMISPNKTVEGALGGIALSLLTAILFSMLYTEWLSFGQALLIGLVCAAAGQLGDLIQSAYKRIRGIKDTGRILPGHGGVLDRCDSWLVVFPLLAFTGWLS